jgi:hypothetical protein
VFFTPSQLKADEVSVYSCIGVAGA